MTLSELPDAGLAGKLKGDGLGIQVGPRGTVVAQGNIVLTGDVRNPVLK